MNTGWARESFRRALRYFSPESINVAVWNVREARCPGLHHTPPEICHRLHFQPEGEAGFTADGGGVFLNGGTLDHGRSFEGAKWRGDRTERDVFLRCLARSRDRFGAEELHVGGGEGFDVGRECDTGFPACGVGDHGLESPCHFFASTPRCPE